MKKILFNDKFGLTEAVLDGRKTMTRRVFKGLSTNYDRSIYGSLSEGFNMMCSGHVIFRRNEYLYRSTFKVGEVVAIAQNYKDAGILYDEHTDEKLEGCAGWTNKMFVKAELMPHQIHITNVRVERLQDISDKDCKREGIDYVGGYSESYYFGHGVGDIRLGNSPREAFAALIDKVSGKGVWDSNPFVFVYEFELVR